MVSYLSCTFRVHVVNSMLHNQETIVCTLKKNWLWLRITRNNMPTDIAQNIPLTQGDQVFLFLQPYKQTSLKAKGRQIGTKFLWTIQNYTMHRSSCLEIIHSSKLQDPPSISCVLFKEGCVVEFPSSNYITMT